MKQGGQLIKLAREARGMTQEYVAESYGIGVRTIQRWESRNSSVSYDDVCLIVTDVCKMTMNEVLELAHDNNNENSKGSEA